MALQRAKLLLVKFFRLPCDQSHRFDNLQNTGRRHEDRAAFGSDDPKHQTTELTCACGLRGQSKPSFHAPCGLRNDDCRHLFRELQTAFESVTQLRCRGTCEMSGSRALPAAGHS